ncbi:Hypothetical protein R9X50_00051800 [Acrodontium crateriforme]|uniref:Natural resistance-associated macrophage protein n=1 Tax=Acrodontium crateriforme TaxID=150365 RepID=A0AAQ3LY04_9PEZI|nr:Hypothetical protein R9X50_00051800 [Acrodontium crateriforme]
MNCPSRTEPEVPDKWNQSPNAFSSDLTTRSDMDKIANARLQRSHSVQNHVIPDLELQPDQKPLSKEALGEKGREQDMNNSTAAVLPNTPRWRRGCQRITQASTQVAIKYAKFMGPGFMISVAYIDPGNYATDIAAGASYRFRLLFMILLSNIFAIFLQSLCIKLGSVSGLNLAEMCKAHMPPWLNYTLYFFAESAIIATDIAEVIGTAIALNLLLHIPLVAGCAISIVDVLVILFFYRPESGNMRALRAFEIFVSLLVVGVVVCFCFQLSLIQNTGVGEVFEGYLPSSALVQSQGLYQACGILGATVMPHSLYLGSGIIQSRLEEFDKANNNIPECEVVESEDDDNNSIKKKYRPTIDAIRSCMNYSIVELAFSLFTFALFVNSAILIVAGASLSNVQGADSADLFGIHNLISKQLAPVAGTIFALALLLSGISAGIVCTIAGQMISEGQLSLKVKPWVRRLMTRCISITPSIIIAGAVGQKGLSTALEASQVTLSVILPFVSAPLIYFTCRNKYMTVGGNTLQRHDSNLTTTNTNDMNNEPRIASEAVAAPQNEGIKMRNHWAVAVLAVLIWGVIVIMNIALLVLIGLGLA